MAWKQWAHLVPAVKPKLKKYGPSYQDSFIQEIISVLRSGKAIRTSKRYLGRLQWRIGDPEFTPKLKLKIIVDPPHILVYPTEVSTDAEIVAMISEKQFKTKFHMLGDRPAETPKLKGSES